jgi:dienelactone hydrolase
MNDLDGFARSAEAFDGITHDVYRAGSGPAVIVIHEIPGLMPSTAAFARRLIDVGFTVWMPSLFGQPGRDASGGYVLTSLARVCVSREFHMFALGRSSPVVVWLRALAAKAHDECGGPGVGAIGMCFSGGFALAMAADARMIAPVLSQPANPAPLSSSRAASLDITPVDFARVKQRTTDDGLCVLGLRFGNDQAVPAARFEMLRRELGDAFISVEIDSAPGNAYGIPKSAHSVLTEHFVDEPGHPTRAALDEVIGFFRRRLLAT